MISAYDICIKIYFLDQRRGNNKTEMNVELNVAKPQSHRPMKMIDLSSQLTTAQRLEVNPFFLSKIKFYTLKFEKTVSRRKEALQTSRSYPQLLICFPEWQCSCPSPVPHIPVLAQDRQGYR